MSDVHSFFLRQCCRLAQSCLGFCAPNPAVGALVVNNGVVVGQGVHQKAGTAHAEVLAILDAGEAVWGTDLYVSLEPCCHVGRTPPCTDAIIKSGIQTVYFAHRDPDVRMQGRGAACLRAAGIACHHVPVEESDVLYRAYDYWQRTHMPWVSLKLAMTQDFKIAAEGGIPASISGDEANRYTHQQRRQHDAILSTAKTVNNDDAALNVRLDGKVLSKPVYLIDRSLSLREDGRLWQTAASITLFYDLSVDPQRIEDYVNRGAHCVVVPCCGGLLDLSAVLSYIAKQGHYAVWAEVGARCVQSVRRANLLQRLLIYRSPKMLGAGAMDALCRPDDIIAKQAHKSRLGDDVFYDFLF